MQVAPSRPAALGLKNTYLDTDVETQLLFEGHTYRNGLIGRSTSSFDRPRRKCVLR